MICQALRLVAALVPLITVGCASLDTEKLRLPSSADCSRIDVDALAGQRASIDAHTDTATLQCVLASLRAGGNPTVRANVLGSRVCLMLASRETDPGRREKLAAEGVQLAEHALAGGGQSNGEAHYYLASNLGFVARDDVALAMANLPRLEKEIKLALALSPEIDQGGALRLLGMLYLKAPSWPAGIGDGDKALELLGQAATKYPHHPLNHLFYAQALWDVDDEEDRAKRELATGLKLLNEGNWGYDREPWQREFEAVRQEYDDVESRAGRGVPARSQPEVLAVRSVPR